MRHLLWYMHSDKLHPDLPDPRLVLAAANEYRLERFMGLLAGTDLSIR